MHRRVSSLFVALLSACAGKGEGEVDAPDSEPREASPSSATTTTLVELPPQGEPEVEPEVGASLAPLAVDLICPAPSSVDPKTWSAMTPAQRLAAHPQLVPCVDGPIIRSCGEHTDTAGATPQVTDPSTWHHACEQAGLGADSCLVEALIPAQVAVCIARSLVGSDAGSQAYVNLVGTPEGGLSWRVRLVEASTGSGANSSASHVIDARTGEYREFVLYRVIPGRPLRAAREIRPRADHSAELSYWLEVAQGEALSVPAFARHVIELEHLGAPAPLIAEARRAVGDEARHFELAWKRASELAGGYLPPMHFEIGESLLKPVRLGHVLREVIEMGCINESLSAHEALQLATHCEDGEVRAIWEEIAADEARHATLAWQVLAWILDQRPDLEARARGIFEASRTGGVVRSTGAPEDHVRLAHRGAASAYEREVWARAAFASIVLPVARQLLG